VRDRQARIVLASIGGALAVLALWTDLPALSGRQFWSDGATYYSMAWSLAEDLDLEYAPGDLARVQREYPAGPQGLFLKRASGGFTLEGSAGFPWVRRVRESEPRIYYAKAFAYPAAAAPFVLLAGTRGLLLCNAACFALALWLGYGEARRVSAPAGALALTLAVLLATVTPVYLLWPQPEIFNVALVTAGFAAWRRDRPLLAAVLLGIATYSKPTHLFLALPLGVAPLLDSGRAFLERLKESVRRGAVLATIVAALYGANAAVTGEMNYQGGERKTFSSAHGRFPFETPGATFGNSGFWMTTERLGPLVEGEEGDRQSRGAGPPLSLEELRGAFLANLGYFWIGRYAGAFPYFPAVVLAAALFLFAGPRTLEGWLALASLLVSYLFYIWYIPANWYGGGGTVGNRYFLSLVPLALLLTPPGRAGIVAALGSAVAGVLLLPLLLSPLRSSMHPGAHAARGLFRTLPAELTMLNDLSFCTEPWRKKQPYGDTEGDAHKHWPADPRAYWLYFPDDGTWGKEVQDGVEGFRLRPGQRAEVILRALEPVRRLSVRVTGGAAGDRVSVHAGGAEQILTVAARESREATFEPGPGFLYYDSFVHVIRLVSHVRPVPDAGRPNASFASIRLEVDKRRR
jgi:hypothetical protein